VAAARRKGTSRLEFATGEVSSFAPTRQWVKVALCGSPVSSGRKVLVSRRHRWHAEVLDVDLTQPLPPGLGEGVKAIAFG